MEKKIWTYNEADYTKIKRLVEGLNVTSTIARILLNRGLEEVEAAHAFLRPTIDKLYNPYLMKDMDKAAGRIREALHKKEAIWIYGDYDVDGVTSTAVLMKYFKSIGYPVNYYIPHRIEEGYGMNCDAIREIASSGGKLIITVDCGITSIQEVILANSLDMDVIITDHHECQGEMPPAYAIINPKQPQCQYPFKYLCGCGIAFKLVQALTPPEIFQEELYQYIDIVALATVADIVEIMDENRIIVKNGIDHMMNTSNKGIGALLEICGLKGKNISTGNIGFMLAPRINAAGRVGSARKGVKLLTTDSPQEAFELAEFLDGENRHRQEIEMNIYNEAVKMLEENLHIKESSFIVLYGKGWHHGVIGIVASRIVEKYYRPTVIITIEDGIAKASARSIPGFNIFDALSKCSHLFIKFGGHEQAAGLSLKEENLEKFILEINKITNEILTAEDFIKQIHFEDQLNYYENNENLLDQLLMLEPHGLGNPSPKFIGRDFEVSNVKAVGNEGKHLKIDVKREGTYYKGIAFNMGNYIEALSENDIINIIYTPEYNIYNGNKSIQFNIKDIKKAYKPSPINCTVYDNYYRTLQLDDTNQQVDMSKIEKKLLLNDEMEEGLFKEIFNSSTTLIIVNTLRKAYKLMELQDIRRKHQKRHYKLYYGDSIERPNKDEVHVIINPNVAKINYSSYNKIILYDQFFTTSKMHEFVRATDIERTIFYYNTGDEAYNLEVINSIVPSRKKMVDLYKVLKETQQIGMEVTFHEVFQRLYEIAGDYTNRLFIANALEIFQEGGLLQYSIRDNGIIFKLKEVNNKVLLEELDTFKKHQQWFFQHDRYKNSIIQCFIRRS